MNSTLDCSKCFGEKWSRFMLTLITQTNKNLKWELLLPWYFSYVVWTQLLSKKQNAQDKKHPINVQQVQPPKAKTGHSGMMLPPVLCPYLRKSWGISYASKTANIKIIQLLKFSFFDRFLKYICNDLWSMTVIFSPNFCKHSFLLIYILSVWSGLFRFLFPVSYLRLTDTSIP